ncbi:histidine kinase [Novosphingobium sp.]|uniref:histidine kinase n=1 Tax=Novosphingobium sp. TaxID=1874826 RepID=UPI00333E981B
MRRIVGVVIAAAGLLAGGGAQAHGWGVQFGVGPAYGRPAWGDGQDWRWRQAGDAVCSGRRAQALEWRLRREVDEGDIDYGTARDIHRSIDRLEDKQRHECDEGDWRAINRIAGRYDDIDGWISTAAGGRRWRGGW